MLTRVAYLAPPSYAKFLSYLTGWMTLIAWNTAVASSAFLGGTLVQGLLVLNYPTYVFQRWHGTLLFYAIIAVALLVNTVFAEHFPAIEAIIYIVHILGFVGIFIALLVFAPHGNPKEVFTVFQNSGGWSSTGLSFFVGLTTSMFSFIGDYSQSPS